jgi:hypothetical protein
MQLSAFSRQPSAVRNSIRGTVDNFQKLGIAEQGFFLMAEC